MNVHLIGSLNCPYVPVSSQVRLVYVRLEIKPQNGVVSLPVNMAVVVDDSQSMRLPLLTQEQFERLKKLGHVREITVDGLPVWEFSGVPQDAIPELISPLSFVKDALRSFLENLSDDDMFALVAFASRAKLLIPATPGNRRRELKRFIDELEQLQLGDETFMAAGLKLGYDEVKRSLSRQRLNRVILLTDGFTQDESQCRSLAQRVADDGISVSTVGIGGGFNEDLMIEIADMSGGNAHFVTDPNDIPRIFRDEMKAVRMVALPGAQLALKLVHGVELRRAYRAKPAIAPLTRAYGGERVTFIPLGDLSDKEQHAVLLELIVPPRPAGIYRLAQVGLEWDDPRQGHTCASEAFNVLVTYTPDESLCHQFDSEVMRTVERVTAADLQTKALRDLQAGDVAAATRKLQAVATRLLNSGDAEQARRAKEVAESIAAQGQLAPDVTKRLRYETRRIGQE